MYSWQLSSQRPHGTPLPRVDKDRGPLLLPTETAAEPDERTAFPLEAEFPPAETASYEAAKSAGAARFAAGDFKARQAPSSASVERGRVADAPGSELSDATSSHFHSFRPPALQAAAVLFLIAARAAKAPSDEAAAHANRAAAALAAGIPSAAHTAASSALAARPAWPKALFRRAEAAVALRRFQEAAADFAAALAAWPEEEDEAKAMLRARLDAAEAAADAADALRAAEVDLADGPATAAAGTGGGAGAPSGEAPPAAAPAAPDSGADVKALLRSADTRERDPRAAALLAQALDAASAGRWAEAAKAARAAFGADPGCHEAAFLAGQADAARGDWNSAAQLFTAARRAERGFLPAYAAAADALERLGRAAEAEESLRAALNISFDFPPALSALARLLLSQGRSGAALALLRLAERGGPDGQAARAAASPVLALLRAAAALTRGCVAEPLSALVALCGGEGSAAHPAASPAALWLLSRAHAAAREVREGEAAAALFLGSLARAAAAGDADSRAEATEAAAWAAEAAFLGRIAQAPQWQRAILAANNRSRASSDAAPASALLPSSCRLRVHAVAFSLDASSAPAAGGWEVYLPRSAVELEGDEAAEAAAPLALPQQLVDTSCESDDAGDEALLQSEARPLAELGNELLDVAAAAAAGGEVRRHSLASGDGNQAHASSVEDGGLHCAGAPAAAAAAAPLPSPLAGAARRFALAALAPDHGAKGGGALAAAAAVTGARALALSQSLPPPLPAAEDSCNNRSAVRTLRSLPSRLCGGAAGPAGEPGPAEGTEEHGGDRFHAAVQDALMGATGTTAAAAWRAVQAALADALGSPEVARAWAERVGGDVDAHASASALRAPQIITLSVELRAVDAGGEAGLSAEVTRATPFTPTGLVQSIARGGNQQQFASRDGDGQLSSTDLVEWAWALAVMGPPAQ